jgi:hypothetical protein
MSSDDDSNDNLPLVAQLLAAEERNKAAIFRKALDARPKATKKAFDKKQVEFIDWARAKGYPSPDLVTEEKVALFLEESVLYRQNRNCKDGSKIVGKSTVNQYIAALTALWKWQVLHNCNSNPTPRGVLVRAIQKRMDSETNKVRKETYFDRGRLYQHLMSSEMKKNRLLIANFFWTYGEDSAFNAFKGLRNRLGYLLSEQGLIRGENVRDLELPDFFSVTYDDEGPMLCTAMVILKGRGKTNQYGKPLFSGYFRHVDVKLCAVSAAAFFLFHRYHIMDEPFPDFSSSQNWYDISMFCTDFRNNMKSMSSSGHARAIYDAYSKLNVYHPKVTHAGRMNGRQLLDKAGVEKVSTDVAGGWSTGAGEGCYGNGLALPSMRAMAGFPSDEKCFYLPRGGLRPPEALLRCVFPKLDYWFDRFKRGDGVDHNYALDGFFRLLFFFREVIIQDAVVLMDDYSHSLFQDPLFYRHDFLSYKQCLKEHMEVAQNPIHMEIQRVMPELCRQITVNNDALRSQLLDAVNNCTSKVFTKIEDGSVEVKSAISNLRLSLSKSLSTVAKALEKEAASSRMDCDSSIVLETDTHIDTSHIEDDDNSDKRNEMPLFENVMACSTSTVPEILLEWEVGINGKPSVMHTNAKWKTKWRMGTKNQKQYSRRKKIMDMICRYASRKRLSREAAAEFIEEKRIMNKLSLLQLADKWQSFEKVVLV